MESTKTAELQVGTQVYWIDEVPKEKGAVLLSEQEVQESLATEDNSKTASRIYSSNVRRLRKMKQEHGLGPFTVTEVADVSANAKRDACHPQHIQISAVPGKFFSGFWFRPVE